ncbi:MAG: hypothetical protein J6C32_01815 [Eubacterium sp.]|nr:hypothetical protein [Eubacterium sp.]
MKRKIKDFILRQKIKLAAALLPVTILGNAVVTYAKEDKGVAEVTKGIEVLKTIVLSCTAGVGVIFLAWGLLDFGSAYSAHDTTQQSMAIKKVIGGIIMVAVPAIIKLLGVA